MEKASSVHIVVFLKCSGDINAPLLTQ